MKYIGWFIGILILVHYNAGILLGRISSPKYPQQPGFFHCSYEQLNQGPWFVWVIASEKNNYPSMEFPGSLERW